MTGAYADPALEAASDGVAFERTVTNYRSSWPSSAGHVPALDGVRGLAIALVIVRHLALLPALDESANWVDRVVRGLLGVGWVGVDLFFALSGFLITGILLRERERPATLDMKLRRFYWRRFLRIIPLYYVACAVLFFVVPHLPYFRTSPDTRVLVANQGWYWLHGVNILEVIRGAAAAPYNTGHFWSLGVEEQFYLVWPLVVLLLPRRALWGVVLTTIAVSPLVRLACILTLAHGVMAATVLSAARLDILLVGALVSLIGATPEMHGMLKRALPTAAGISAVVLALVSLTRGGFSTQNPIMEVVGYSAIACVCGAIIGHTMSEPEGRIHRMFGRATLRWLGKYAYCLYVVHYPLMAVLGLVWLHVHIPAIAGSRMPDTLAFATVLVALSAVIAVISWRFLESKALAYKDREPWRSTADGV